MGRDLASSNPGLGSYHRYQGLRSALPLDFRAAGESRITRAEDQSWKAGLNVGCFPGGVKFLEGSD